MLDLDIFEMNLRFSQDKRLNFPEKQEPEMEHVFFSKNTKSNISFIMIFSFTFLCIFQNFLNRRITLMDSMTKNMSHGGRQTSEQALVLPLTILIWGLLNFFEP